MEMTFLTDIKEMGRRAGSHMEEGAVTEGYRADRETVLQLTNEALATELVCVLRSYYASHPHPYDHPQYRPNYTYPPR